MITIRIDGFRNSGRTTTAIAIVRLLQQLGQDVSYRGGSAAFDQLIEESIPDFPVEEAFHQRRQFQVIDSQEE